MIAEKSLFIIHVAIAVNPLKVAFAAAGDVQAYAYDEIEAHTGHHTFG